MAAVGPATNFCLVLLLLNSRQSVARPELRGGTVVRVHALAFCFPFTHRFMECARSPTSFLSKLASIFHITSCNVFWALCACDFVTHVLLVSEGVLVVFMVCCQSSGMLAGIFSVTNPDVDFQQIRAQREVMAVTLMLFVRLPKAPTSARAKQALKEMEPTAKVMDLL